MNEKNKINEITYREELPQIIIEKRKMLPDNIIQESEYYQVRGKTLNECKKILDKIKSK